MKAEHFNSNSSCILEWNRIKKTIYSHVLDLSVEKLRFKITSWNNLCLQIIKPEDSSSNLIQHLQLQTHEVLKLICTLVISGHNYAAEEMGRSMILQRHMEIYLQIWRPESAKLKLFKIISFPATVLWNMNKCSREIKYCPSGRSYNLRRQDTWGLSPSTEELRETIISCVASLVPHLHICIPCPWRSLLSSQL